MLAGTPVPFMYHAGTYTPNLVSAYINTFLIMQSFFAFVNKNLYFFIKSFIMYKHASTFL